MTILIPVAVALVAAAFLLRAGRWFGALAFVLMAVALVAPVTIPMPCGLAGWGHWLALLSAYGSNAPGCV